MLWDAMKVSEPSFARVWDNNEDAVYDNLSPYPLIPFTARCMREEG